MNTMARTLQILTGQVKPSNTGVVWVGHLCEDDGLLEEQDCLTEAGKRMFAENTLKVIAALDSPKDVAQIVGASGLCRTTVQRVLKSMVVQGVATRTRKTSGIPSYLYSLTEEF